MAHGPRAVPCACCRANSLYHFHQVVLRRASIPFVPIRRRRTLLLLGSRGARTTLAVLPYHVLTCSNFFSLPPGPPSFVRLSDNGSGSYPVSPGWVLYSIANTPIRGNTTTKRRRGMGEAGRRVETLPCTNICSAWSPLAILLQIPMSRNYDIASMILRRLHL
ncbi:hypothetical protein EDB84DRAFT_555340 [Lactarius hengduanensis]|nr:hypothetical protein EDB84DRAFT_555340 [Lactarius hengduanensis]